MVVPHMLLPSILAELHNAPTGGHLGVVKVLEKAHSGMLRLATPVFGISNISNFNHYKMPHFLKDGCYSYVSLYQTFLQ